MRLPLSWLHEIDDGGEDRGVRFAVVHDVAGVKPWQAAAVEHLRADGAELALRIELAPPVVEPAGRGAAVLWAASGRRAAGGARRLPDTWSKAPSVTPEEVRAARLDFVLHFGSNLAPEGLLDAARHGVWAFVHDEEERRTGRPPAFWEASGGSLLTDVALARLARRPEDDEVLARSVLKTAASYALNLAAVELECEQLPSRALRNLSGSLGASRAEGVRSPASAAGSPSSGQLAAYVASLTLGDARAAWQRATAQEDWGIGIIDAPIQSFLTRPPAAGATQWLPRPRPGECYTDPFGLVHEGRTWLFFEHFDRDLGRGVIAGSELLGSGELTAPQQVMNPGIHTSYPYVFEHEGAVYCIPETGWAQEIALHRAEGLPGPWRRVATLVKGFWGFDATICHFDGRWWLWAGRYVSGRDVGPISALYVWHAPALEGPWSPHRANPVKVDIRSCRPGGTPFTSGGRLYRPAQDGSIVYGGRVVINEVLRMTPDTYEERIVAAVSPDPAGPYPLGLHTLSAVGNRTLIDGKRSRPVGLHDLRRRALRLASIVGTRMRRR